MTPRRLSCAAWRAARLHRHQGRALEFAAEALHDDEEVVIAAVRQNGYALQWATPRLRADKEVVTEAVRQRGAALGYASTALRMRPDIQALAAESGWR